MGRKRPICKDLYECYNHSRNRTRYHIILVTKYRRKCLSEIEDVVYRAFRECESRSDITIRNMKLDGDHIHLLISFPSKYSISQTINRLKQFTTKYLYSEQESYLKNWYWKKKRVLWSDSYFVSTIGSVSEEKVMNYIENQGL